MDNWLAAVPISEEYKQARDKLDGKDASSIYVKAFAAQLKNIVFKDFAQKTSIPMLDPQDLGIYSATLSQTSVPDGHKLYVTAVGSTEERVVFRREHAMEMVVSVRPDPKFTLVDVVYSNISAEMVTATLRITPRDRFGNLMLIDPSKSHDILLKAENANVGNLRTIFDGTYLATLTYRAGVQPTISLAIGGKEIFIKRPLPAIDKLKYVDRLVTFKPGLEGARGANKHVDAAAVLGDIATKPADWFVSLGGSGVLAVGMKEGVVVAQGDDDITIFVNADADLRSYLVEAQTRGKPWHLGAARQFERNHPVLQPRGGSSEGSVGDPHHRHEWPNARCDLATSPNAGHQHPRSWCFRRQTVVTPEKLVIRNSSTNQERPKRCRGEASLRGVLVQ